uniref:Uncharacterized protein ycf23 n=1 Tax=Antithamnion sp. TaxID=2767 RepID=YCF23_ANTSP|nr:RecName: Full=Uncharacterized protein ycf23 [Antithamnion sp.]CAA83938.1 unknown [Antithamnion sp.]
MNLRNNKLHSSFIQRKAIKVISGINNFNVGQIFKIIHACEISKATYVDVARNPKIVSFIKSISSIPVCVSSIDPRALYESVLAGADLVEIGNFDCFYTNGVYLSNDQIIAIVKQVKYLLPYTDICVTIPHILKLHEQIYLAQKLESLGINLLQTEGSITNFSNEKLLEAKKINDNILYSTSMACCALSSVYSISKVVSLPVIASSGINGISASVALSYGASGIGIRSSVSKLGNIIDMSNYIDEMIFSTSKKLYDIDQNNLLYMATSNLSLNKCSII